MSDAALRIELPAGRLALELEPGSHPNALRARVKLDAGGHEATVDTIVTTWEIRRFEAAMLALTTEEDGAAKLESDDDDLSLTVSRDGSAWRLSLGFDFADGLVWLKFPIDADEAARLGPKAERLALRFPVVPSG